MIQQGMHSLSQLVIQIYSDGADPVRTMPPGGGEWRERCKIIRLQEQAALDIARDGEIARPQFLRAIFYESRPSISGE